MVTGLSMDTVIAGNTLADSRVCVDLVEVYDSDVQEFGRKAAILGQMIRQGIQVPTGLCFSHSILHTLYGSTSDSHTEKSMEYSHQMQPEALSGFILDNVHLKFGYSWMKRTSLVVRSSASVENSKAASFAGIFQSVPSVNSEPQLVESVTSCWNSQFADHVSKYMQRMGLSGFPVRLGIIVQEMVVGDVSGVVFTRTPILPRRNATLLIEAAYGLCTPVVQGTCNPDRYWVDIQTFRTYAQQAESVQSFETYVELSEQVGSKQSGCLSAGEVKRIARTSLFIERLFDYPQDIEWTLRGGELFILQSRPLTSLSL